MLTDLKLPRQFLANLVCPRHKDSVLLQEDSQFVCSRPGCGMQYPIIEACPILINEENSVFAIKDFENRRVTTMNLRRGTEGPRSFAAGAKDFLRRLVPDISESVSDITIAEAAGIVRREIPRPRVLVVGAGDAKIEFGGEADVVYSDVAQGPLTHLVADAHDIPFRDASFDLVIAAAVLEHVADPTRCVEEIARVLSPHGYVYAVTPFMQQVHLAAYDFTRFTYVGHRRLFRRFEELRSGVANGPAMALAWAFEHFVAAFAVRPRSRATLRSLARIMIFPLVQFDRILARRPAAYSAASAYYFFGRKMEKPISDREVIASYRPPVR